MADSDIKLYGTLVRDRAQDKVVNGSQVKGGFFTCASVPSWAGETGQLCYCTNDSKFYQYNGSSWAVAQLGGGGKYQHNIEIRRVTGTNGIMNCCVSFQLITSDASAYTTISEVKTALAYAGFTHTYTRFLPASGLVLFNDSSSWRAGIVVGVCNYNSTDYITVRVSRLASNTGLSMTFDAYISMLNEYLNFGSYTNMVDTVIAI